MVEQRERFPSDQEVCQLEKQEVNEQTGKANYSLESSYLNIKRSLKDFPNTELTYGEEKQKQNKLILHKITSIDYFARTIVVIILSCLENQ